MIKYKKIVLVDDDADDRQVFEDILRDMDPGTLLACAENGLEMVAMLDKMSDDELPDMIILDQNMPKMTGKESLLFLRESNRYSHIPIILYSILQVPDFYNECLELGATDVVAKPDTLQAYRGMIEQLLVAH
jgi:CheY-like chemotaxis protein